MMVEEGRDGADVERLVRRYYEEPWNEWRFELTEELLAPDVRFRGSLGLEVRGVDAQIYLVRICDRIDSGYVL